MFGVVGDFACNTRTSSALRSAGVEKVPRANVMRRVFPVLRCTTSAAHADFLHQQEPVFHGKPAAASALVTSSVHCLSVTGGTVTELLPRLAVGRHGSTTGRFPRLAHAWVGLRSVPIGPS